MEGDRRRAPKLGQAAEHEAMGRGTTWGPKLLWREGSGSMAAARRPLTPLTGDVPWGEPSLTSLASN